ncbi:hypothetical protein [Streptomyces albipurpureus]|uniref:WXG100 family type VII secretion target n=1 Tax=Streptomyces albipurpureus TaxID=2897419 RepID=A0ABT0UTF8_9ACTN|nr:hypothetical protein [Streptomyces sp. CWNU-1]MCM2391269.1 hypothetical protein [Streptomyces sp. CWNU-1]
MAAFGYSDLIALDLGKLNTAVGDWQTMVGELAKLKTEVTDGMVKKSAAARWEGVNASVTKEFVGSTAKEFGDLHAQAQSIHSVLADAHGELTRIQKQARKLTEEARRGNPERYPEADPGLLISDGSNGTVKVVSTICDAQGPSQRTQDMVQWYADTLTGLVAHAAEVDAAVTRALKTIHGGDPFNAGHATHTSLDQDQLPRAMKLAALGGDANDRQQDELRRLWQSLSPQARAELWMGQRDNLLAAGLLSPTVKKVAADRGSGRFDSEDPGGDEWITREKMHLLITGSEWSGMNDAGKHMMHYLDRSGDPLELPVDRMLSDDEDFKNHIDNQIRRRQDEWREQALAEFHRNGGKPIAIPVETVNRDYTFDQEKEGNWYYAVGSTRSNVTGIVTVTPDATGQPRVGLEYQANAWDRYNWDKGKGVQIGPVDIPDGEMGRQHTVGHAQEFDMAGSSSVKHYDLGGATPNTDPLPKPPDPGRDGGRTDPGR